MMTSIFKRILYLAVLVIILTSCDNRVRTSQEILFDHIFFKIKLNSIKRNEVNWSDLEKKVKDSVKVFASRQDYERAVNLTLKLLDDHHSAFYGSGSRNPFFAKKRTSSYIVTQIIGNNIGYIRIPGFAGNDSLSRLFSIRIRNALSWLDQQGELSGWIVDVRGNSGGRDFIFPLGIAPLLQDSVVILNKNTRGEKFTDLCLGNVYFQGETSIISIPECKRLANKDKPVAVLMDSNTASGGEMTVVLLKNRKTARTFGSMTYGATSTLSAIDIKDKNYHALLLLATKNWYNNDTLIKGKLIPDVECLARNSLDSAVRWIEKYDHPLLAKEKMVEAVNQKK